MQLSKKSQYGIRVAVQLALLEPSGQYVQSRDLATQEHLPAKFLEQVLLRLRKGGILESKVGSGGGYRLKVPADQIAMTRFFDLFEGAASAPSATSATGGIKALRHLTTELQRAQAAVFDRWTLAELVDIVAAAPSDKGRLSGRAAHPKPTDCQRETD